MEGINFKNNEADQQRLQISELHFDKFPTPQTFFVLENEVQDRSMHLLKISYGGNAMDRRSRDG